MRWMVLLEIEMHPTAHVHCAVKTCTWKQRFEDRRNLSQACKSKEHVSTQYELSKRSTVKKEFTGGKCSWFNLWELGEIS